MLSDDTFRAQIDAVIDGLHGWADANRHLARMEEVRTPRFWRLAMEPRKADACPFELILHADQRYDAAIGPEVYEDRPIERVDLFAPLLAAVVAGRVVTRTWRTAGTGAIHSVETIVRFEKGTLTGERVDTTVAACVALESCLASDRHWLPYDR